MTPDNMTSAQCTAQAASYDSAADNMRAQSRETKQSLLPFGHADAGVVNACLNNIAREFDNLAVYFAGKAQGFRHDL